MENVKARSCFACIRGTAHCGMCGDELEHFILMSNQSDEEARMDVVGSNGNEGLHYDNAMHERVEIKLADYFAEAEAAERKTAPGLLKAAADIMQQRAEQYDKPEGERSMGAAVQAFNVITGRDMKESEGWLLLQVLKDVRQWQRPDYHADSAEDCIAYSALKAEALAKGL